MVRLLGLRSFGFDPSSPREITGTNPVAGEGSAAAGGENGWLIRFFDSSFFCEWIAVSYLYKHEHSGVRDYLCNRMYTLPLPGIESYLFQICYMLVYKPSPSLDRFVIDTCSKSLRIALKVHWFLLAELEDSEDSDGVSRIQEKCQIAATVLGEWPPLIRPSPAVSISPSSPRGNPVLTRILSSKQKLFSLASSPSVLSTSSPIGEGSKGVADHGDGSRSKGLTTSEDGNLLLKLIPGPKVRDALLFRKSVEKDEAEPEKDGFFKRLLRDSKDREEEEAEKDGFLKRLLSSKEKPEEDTSKDGFFQRLRKDTKDEEVLTGSSEGFMKRLFHDKEEKPGEEDDKEGFFRRIFKEKNEEKKDDGCDRIDDVDKINGSVEVDEKENFFRRLFKDKNDEKTDNGHSKVEEKDKISRSSGEDNKDGFFHRLFKDKNEEKKDSRTDVNEDGDKINKGTKDDEKVSLFRRLYKDKREEKKESGQSKSNGEDKCKKSVEDDNIFRRLFKDKGEEKKATVHDKHEEVEHNGSVNDGEKEGFLRRFFSDKHEGKKIEGHDKNDEDVNSTIAIEEEETPEFLPIRRLFRIHPEETKTATNNEHGNSNHPLESSPGTENFFQRLFRDRERSIEDSELIGASTNIHKEQKPPGSPKQQNEKPYGKPPLPNNLITEFRKGSYHASLEFVQSLCDTSYGLVDIFPIEDRKIALRETLTEINSQLVAAQKDGGVCFPMGKGMYQVVHIPEDEAVLLNSREKAPYLICVEVLKCETPRHSKVISDAQKLSRAGIPLANRDAQLPKPPPWAYPLWSQPDVHRFDMDGMLRSTSQAIDQAMTQLWESKVKFVHVSFSIGRKFDHKKTTEEIGTEGRIQQTLIDGEGPISTSAKDNEFDMDWVSVNLSAVPGVNMEDVDDQEPLHRKDHRRIPSTIAIAEVKAAAAKGEAPPGLPLKGGGQDSQNAERIALVMNGDIPKPTDALSGELWEVKKERIRRSSAYGKLPGWDLRSVIVKSGDDCRQEHLAVQLVSHFYGINRVSNLPFRQVPLPLCSKLLRWRITYTFVNPMNFDIYQEAGLPLWLRPYEILVTSSYTALIETIPDTASIHSIKSRFLNISSLRDYFIAKFGENSQNFKLAQRNFVESMAGYSILCYLLQVKDRHNGNILIDEEGHIIHIDFGFMLSNSPGGVNFESAPFKLTRELLEVMDSDAEGTPSEFFDYYKVLCIQGFLTCRKHAERIILLVEMVQDSGFPCFKGGPRTIQNLRKRFHLSLTEEQCVSLVLSLVSSSLDAWRTRQYDYYQRVLNGIL